jgi:hypothetical protein
VIGDERKIGKEKSVRMAHPYQKQTRKGRPPGGRRRQHSPTALGSRLVDELHVDIMPVFLDSGLRSFESSSLERVRLEKIEVQEVGARASLRFRIKGLSTSGAGGAVNSQKPLGGISH